MATRKKAWTGRGNGLRVLWAWLALVVAGLTLSAQDRGSGLSAAFRDGELVLWAGGAAGMVQTLQRSVDLRHWTDDAVVHEGLRDYPVGASGRASHEFFRVVSAAKTVDDDFKNQIQVPGEAFESGSGVDGQGGLRWVKWTIDLAEPARVFFQDSTKYPFHYDFGTRRLGAVAGMSPSEFDAVSLHPEAQRLVLGAVVFPADPSVGEVGIQIVGRQPFPVGRVAEWFKTVRSRIVVSPGLTFYYLPTYEQGGLSADDRAFLAAEGIPVGSPARWVTSDECYSTGWAFGRFVFVSSGEIRSAFTDGRLLSTDLLLTDAVPAEIPRVAGVISLSPGTPNSHVAILSRSVGAPFVHVTGSEVQARLRSWEGREVLLLAEPGSDGCTVRTLDVEGRLTEAQRQKLVEAKRAPVLEIEPKAVRGVFSLPVGELTPADLRYVGGKAANFGLLIRSLPANTDTDAIAFTFDLWDAFLDQVVPGGGTLRGLIQTTLARHSFPPDMAALTRDLADLRLRIRNQTDFSAEQKAQILAALRGFDPDRNLRFRSSTNVEDSDVFSGAGLYDSYSGCVADDTDSDTGGPSRCDPTEDGERGVFRALRRVYASFYNDNAFLERLRYGMDEAGVGMAVLVHPSAPDAIELANGVSTLRVRRHGGVGTVVLGGEMVSQPGAFSVANAASNALPEVVTVEGAGVGEPLLQVQRGSGLLPLGRTVLEWPGEYAALLGMLDRVGTAWLEAHPARDEGVLDFEYKKLVPGRLWVKQVREVPQGPVQTNPPPFTLNDAGRLVVFQHHGKDLFANHRLKSVWHFRSLVFAGEGPVGGFNDEVDVEHHDGVRVESYSGPLGGLPNARTQVSGTLRRHDWTWGEGEGRRELRLQATFPSVLDPARPRPLSEATLIELSTRYATPQPRFGELGGAVTWVTNEVTRLVPLDKVIEGTLPRRRTFQRGHVRIDVQYTLSFLKFGVAGIGIFDGKSFPLVRWGETTLRGLTSGAIELRGEFSRTYDSSRHNFEETFLFEPRLDANADPAVLLELEAANIKAVLVRQFTAMEGTQPAIWLWGFDDRLREVR